jgi:aminoglycoside phosphotransferase (APT) family kinase protein
MSTPPAPDRPWQRADVHVNEAVVRAALSSIPQLAGASIRYLHEGWDSRAFLIDDAWVFRFPKRRPMHERLAVEIALLPRLAPLLPVSIPRFEHIGAPGPAYPYRFVGYRILPGAIGSRLDPTPLDLPALGAQIGRALAALHAFPVEEALRLGARTDTFNNDLPGRASEARGRLTEIAPHLSAAQHDRAAAALVPPAPPQDPPCLIHNDLASEHLLIDLGPGPGPTPPGTLLGIIDWGDMAIGDPAIDFSAAYHIGGAAALHAALQTAGRAQDPAFLTRARFHAVRRAVEDIHYGLGDNRPEYVTCGRRVLDWP